MHSAILLFLIAACMQVYPVASTPLFWGGKPVKIPSNTPTSGTIPTLRPASPKPSPSPNPSPIFSPPLPEIVSSKEIGRMTYYGVDGDPPPTRFYGSCGFEPDTVADNFVAMNANQYVAGMCGRCVEMTYGSHCAEGVIVDKCPGCPSGGIDTSLGIFAKLVGGESVARHRGVVPDVAWHLVTCGSGCK